MPRSAGAIKRNRDKKKWLKKNDANNVTRYHIPAFIPESTCEHCRLPPGDATARDYFDENGYQIPKPIVQAGKSPPQQVESTLPPDTVTQNSSVFRFMDLPPEIRNRIYEFAAAREKQPVCVPDGLLRPSEDLSEATDVLRHCHSDVVCLPCQLHQILGTGPVGLSRASQQLHSELALIPYTVNTFSLHNLYYLQMFLRSIGPKARQTLRSLRFAWMLPQEEAMPLGIYTSVEETYSLLGECQTLVALAVDIDADNLLTWKGSGRPRSVPLTDLREIPHVALIVHALRGLKDIRIGWKCYEGLEIEQWARWLLEQWRSPKGTDEVIAVNVDVEVTASSDGHWRSIHWTCDGTSRDEDQLLEHATEGEPAD